MLRREPETFRSDPDVFTKLVRMQHHGLPTRLLDLTTNPLIALFFACCSQPKKDGQIFLFHHSAAKVLFPADIPGPPLSGLETRLDTEGLLEGIVSTFFYKITFAQNEIKKKTFGCTDFYNEFVAFLDGCVENIDKANEGTLASKMYTLSSIENKLIPDFFSYWHDKLSTCPAKPCYKEEENQDSTLRLLKFKVSVSERMDETISRIIRNAKFPAHMRYTSYADFLYEFFSLYFVSPPNNNERIRRQHGVFLLFPPLSGEGVLIEDIYNPLSIIIKKGAKSRIISQLGHLGISRAYLFPELEEQAQDIKQCYSISK